MRKWFISAAALVLLLLAAPAVHAETADAQLVYVEPERFASSQVQTASAEQLSDYVDMGQLRKCLIDGFSKCADEVNVCDFQIPYSEDIAKEIRSLIWYEIPELFHVGSLAVVPGYDYQTGKEHVARICVGYFEGYADTAEEYTACFSAFTENAEKLLSGVKGNKNLTDVEKALLLHDRLVLWTEYDYRNYLDGTLPDTVYNAYGVFANQKAVCAGYTVAYMYLLEQVGIESDYCGSEKLNHAWNIVYIDGEAYHVDATWDDPVWDETGKVMHNNFLLSTEGIIATGHISGSVDYITTPTSKKYDNYYWKDSIVAFQLIGNTLYYIDQPNEMLRSVKGTSYVDLQSVANKWVYSEYGYALGCARLGSVGNLLLYSQPNGVYAYDVDKKVSQLVFEPDRSFAQYISVYGFKYEDGYLICDLANFSHHNENGKDNQVRFRFVPSNATYTVTFKDEKGNILSGKTYKYGQIVDVPAINAEVDSNGYYLDWNKPVTVCLGDATYSLTGKMTDKYKVEFLDWDGTVLSTGWYDIGDVITAPPYPTRAEDDVAYYFCDAWDRSWNICTGNMTINAFYTTTYKQYTVQFVDWDGSILSSGNGYFWGETVNEPWVPYRQPDQIYSYTFTGWDKEVTACKGDAIYKAQYSRTYVDYWITFTDWDGTRLSSKTYHWGDPVVPPETPARQADGIYSYVFDGWSPAVTDCYGEATYTATYRAIPVPYTVTFKNWDGSELSQKTYIWGETVIAPPAPVRPADDTFTYSFLRWDKTVTECYGDATYTAIFRADHIYYTVIFKDHDGRIISQNTYCWDDAIVTPADPVRADDADFTYTFAGWDQKVGNCRGDQVFTATYEATEKNKEPARPENGWWQDDGGKWYFFEKGTMVRNDWRKDSVGWCYLTADGSMATNKWIADSKGWCYVGADGYCWTNCWAQDSVGWVWLDKEGSMVYNQWIQYKGKWYFVGSDGYMVTNEWRKDSKGWCWLTADGSMATNQWVKDSKGWCYIGADGYCWTNCWAKDSTGWVWLDREGSMVYNKWIQDGGKWYYVGADGYMLANTTWNGYKFNASGVCTNP